MYVKSQFHHHFQENYNLNFRKLDLRVYTRSIVHIFVGLQALLPTKNPFLYFHIHPCLPVYMVLHIFQVRSTYLLPVLATPVSWHIIPYRFDVELHLTALFTVKGPVSCTNIHVILQCLMLVFLKLLFSSGCFGTWRLDISVHINLDLTSGNYKNN
jgi:hypothetical protein